MATDLTGLKVKDTYNSLLKIGDNSSLSATPDKISDGLGNESILYLSTSQVSIGTLPATGYDLTVNSAIKTGSIDIVGAATAATLRLTGGSGSQGTLSWNTDEETVDIIQNGATLQVGQEVQVHVKNQTGSTITDGTPVYVTGTLGSSGRLTVAPMIADGSIEAKYFLGITTEDIPNGEDGKVTTFGKIRGLDTTAYSEGQTLYVSASTAGAFQTTAPVAPNLDLEVAIVINVSANNGTIFVRAQQGYYLGLLHDVYLNNPANNQFLVYNSTTSRWENQGIASVGSINLDTVTDNGNTTTNNINVGDISAGNMTLSGYLRGAANFVIDPAAYGDETGVVQILGDLRVDGTTTTINSTTVTIDDKNIVLANNAATAGDANGAGITVETGTNTPTITDATILYNSTNDTWGFNKWVTASKFVGDLEGDVTGDLTGNADTASALATARNIAVDGAVTGNADFDGSGDITITTSVNHNHNNLYYTETEADARFVNQTGDTMTGNLNIGNGSASEYNINIGQSRTGNGYAYVDLVGDETYTDYGLRMIRYNSGENAVSELHHRGTGDFRIRTREDANLLFKTSDTDALTINTSQDVIVHAGSLYVNAGSISASGTIGNLTSGSLGQQMEKGDASQTTLRFDANRWRLYAGANAGEIFTAQEDGKIGVNTIAPKTKFDVVGTVYGQQKVLDADTTVPNQNLLNDNSIKISNRNDIYGNATKTVISDYEATYDNSTGSTTIRLYIDDGILVNGETYTISVYYKNLEGDLSIDFCDVGLTGAYRNASGTSSNPTSGRIHGYATRNTYDSTYRFVDINLSTGGTVTLLHPKVELGNIVTDFVHEERVDSQPQDLVTNNITTTGNITSIGNVKGSYFISEPNTSIASSGARDWVNLGAYGSDASRAAAVQIGDVNGARYAMIGGGYDLTFAKHLSSSDTWSNIMRFESLGVDTDADVRILNDLTVDGSLFVSGTIDLTDANLDIGSADIIFGIDATDTGARGLVWNFDADGNGTASNIGYIRAGGTVVGEKMQFNMNAEGTITGSNTVYQFMNGGTEVFTIGANGFTESQGDFTSLGYLQAHGYLYTRDNLRVLNTAGNGWNTWATRSNGNYNLNVGSISGSTGTFSGSLDVAEGIEGKYFSVGNSGKSYNWRPVNNTSTNSGYFKIARITATQSSRFIIELAGRSTSYSDGQNPSMGYIVGQLNNDSNYDIVYYNHSHGSSEVVQDVGQVDVDTVSTDIYVQLGQFAELTAHAHISDGEIIPESTSSASTIPTGYTSANVELKVWNSGNDGIGSGLDADTVDTLQASQFLRSDADDTGTGTITISGKDQSFIADYDVAGQTWSGRIISKNDTTGVASFLGNYNGVPGVFAHNSALNAWNSIFINTLATTGNGNANVYTGTLYINGNIAWHAGNDGSGSNLDADLLDGVQGASYLRSDADDTYAGNLTINGNVSFTGNSRYIDLSGGDTNSQNALIIGEQNVYGVRFRWDSGSALQFDGYWNSSTTGTENRDLGYIDVDNRIWYLNKRVQANESLRAPIFYDSDSTSYYVNPASTSNLNSLVLASSLQIANRDWAGSIGAGQNYIASSTSTSNRGNYGAGVWSYSGFTSGTNRPHTYDATLQVMATSAYGFELSADWLATNKTPLKIRSLRDCCQGWSTWVEVMTQDHVHSGNFFTTGSMRAGVFYDQNDTNFYVNPNGVSVLDEVIIRCDSRASSDATKIFRLDGNYTDGRWAHRFRKQDLGGGVPLFIDFSSTTANSYTALARFGAYSGNTNEFEVFGDGKFNGALETVGDINAGVYTVRSTNFRASNAYYLGNTNFYLNSDGSGWYSNVKIQSADSLRAPIFYDSDNTSFYVNPTGTSFLNGGIELYNGDVNLSDGFLTIEKGHADTRFEMLYDNGTASQNAQLLLWASEPGITYHGVGMGANISFSGQYYGRRTSALSYGLYMRMDASNGSTYFSTTTGAPGTTGGQGGTRFQIDASGNTFSFGSSRAPIFYDYDNTAYYCNPNGTSLLSKLIVDGSTSGWTAILGSNDVSRAQNDNSRHGLVINADNYPHIDVNATNTSNTNTVHGAVISMTGSISGGYRRWGMGISQYNPNELSFGYYDNQSNPHYGVGINWAASAKMWIDTSGHLYSTGSMRSPIFYDYNNTSYYLDPASTSYLNTVSLGAQTWRGTITWNAGVNININGECSFDMFSGQFGVWNSNTQTWSIRAPHEAQVEIGQAGNRGLKVFGTITATADVVAYSDIRTKENVKTIDSALEKVTNLRGVEYNRIGETDKKIGVIAQEIEKILPEVVTEDKDGMKAVSYGNIVGVLIEAIKDQQQQIDELKSLINKS